MFKKLKDKLAEEVKSSPQRFQQIAQAAQAVVTSASSSVSDITNNDLFSIGDNDKQTTPTLKAQGSNSQQSEFQDVTLMQNISTPKHDPFDITSNTDFSDHQRQRRLSNSSLASDVSFRLPSYESPSMYHLQSDMEVSASEAEERGFSSGSVNLDRVTKEQLYSAYKRTQERYSKYRTQYADLARHYKLLERENAKAKSVLVETQDKALRRISELKEQCSLEQSAKAHLEQALRVEIDERNMKIESLNSKISLLQSNPEQNGNESKPGNILSNEQLIDFSGDSGNKPLENIDLVSTEVTALNTKMEKMEQLITKYKESLKTMKEKNSQIFTELQIANNELQNKNKEIEKLNDIAKHLTEARQKIHELSEYNELLQNKINTFEFNKSKEFSVLELDFQKSQEEINELKGKIEVFAKREEEYAISLAENKLSIHKELENKETEIKSLKDSLASCKNEVQYLNILTNDYKNTILSLEEEKARLNNVINDLNLCKTKLSVTEPLVIEFKQKCQSLDQQLTNAKEEYKCLELQLKQETAEKFAMIDRNTYLNTKNNQLTEENEKKSLQISSMKQDIETLKQSTLAIESSDLDPKRLLEEVELWKSKYNKVKSEIHEEKDELVKLQSEIEKLLNNHDAIQNQYEELQRTVSDLTSENIALKQQIMDKHLILKKCGNMLDELKPIKENISFTKDQFMYLRKIGQDVMSQAVRKLDDISKVISESNSKDTYEDLINEKKLSIEKLIKDLDSASNEISSLRSENENLKLETHNSTLKNNKLIDTLSALQNDKIVSENIIKELKDNINWSSTEIQKQQEENKALNYKIQELVLQNNGIKKEFNDIKLLYDDILQNFTSLKKENEDLFTKLKESNTNCNNLESSLKKIEERYAIALATLENENKNLANTIAAYESKSASSTREIEELRQECEVQKEKLELLGNERDELLGKIQNLENQREQSQNTIRNNDLLNEKSAEELTRLKSEIHATVAKVKDYIDSGDINDNIINNISVLTNELIVAKTEVNKLNHECKTMTEKIQFLIEDREELLEKSKEFENRSKILLDEMKELKLTKDTINMELQTKTSEVDGLKNNNINLVGKIEDLRYKYKEQNEIFESENNEKVTKIGELEALLTQSRNLYTELETEKDHLTAIIEQLQNENLQTSNDNKNTQISFNNEHETLQKSREASSENNQQKEYELVKEENKRLKSDIEGLQTYLTKISKENCVLNDKLRELIATSEHCPDKIAHHSHGTVRNIDELTKENTILVQENLELKDQLDSHLNNSSYTDSLTDNNQDFNALKGKYESLENNKRNLESRLTDLEVMNRSLSTNMQQMQDNNDKLKLSNEKLQLRLDEALVSLRHLHSLEENTELEYLRNILFEYLTGPGTHSATLAKVLAAVVKFDDRQTQQVLQKEKERQGLLQQLGLM